MIFFFFFLKNAKHFNTHIGRGKKVVKKLIVMYIYKGLTLAYTLNLFNSYSFLDMGLM